MAWLKDTMLLCSITVGILLLYPTQLQAQSGEEPSVMPQPEDFTADLIPNNNTIINQLPATFYCLITDTILSMNISTDWYINDALVDDLEGLFAEYTRIVPRGMNTNLTIFSLRFTNILVPSVNVSCRTPIFPNVTYGFYQVGNPDFTPVVVIFEEEIVNGSEGNVAVVCASAFIPEEVLRLFEESLRLTVDVSVVDQGSAETSDYGPLPSNLTFTSIDRKRCLRILLTNDTVTEGIESFTLELSHSTNTQSTIGNNAILIPMEMNRTIVQILETCIDGEVRLRSGFDKNQGRVEVCYKREWGTVCDDGGWAGGGRQNAQVVCQQLGLESQGAQSLSFTGATFGPGSIFLPIHLDNVFCNGNESNLLNCMHNPVGVHNCIHSQDVSVDCLGRSQVGAPCSSVGEIRLVGGVDEFQGRVEVCTEALVYSTVCSSGWDIQDAQVVCRQLGLENTGVLAARDALFGLGVGTISYQNVNCAGSERNFSQCINGQTSTSCTHFQDAGVECLGRPIPGAPLVGFERTAQDNGNLLAIREGETLELCVVLLSGSLASETVIQIFTNGVLEDFRKRATQAIDQFDFIVQARPAARERGVYEVLFGVNTTRSCFNVTAVDDNIDEDTLETVEFRISQTRQNQGFIQVSPSAVTARLGILDDDFICNENGVRCIEPLNARAFCLRSTSVCNRVPECSDGSDETNCTAIIDYCVEAGIEGYNCVIERRCIPQEHFCDGVPDCGLDVIDERLGCTDNCTQGKVRPSPLLNDSAVSEGLVDVCVNGTYFPISLDNGRFSVREATVLCKQLGLGDAGIPLSQSSTGDNIQAERLAQVKCTGNENSITDCNITSTASGLTGNQQAQVRCFSQEPAGLSCEDGMIRLSPDGPSRIEGRVEMCYQNIWGAVYDQSWSGFDAAVVCAQLNFSRTGALPITGVLYSPVDRIPFVYANPNCVGNETSLLDCPSATQQLGQTGFYQDQNNGMENNFVAVRCENFPASDCNYLDARLTFRRAKSTGYLEICNREGQWSVVCGSSLIPVDNVRVICNQLGFDPNFVGPNNVLQSTSVLNIGRPIINDTSGLGCKGNESNLTACPQIEVSSTIPGTAGSVPVTCNSLEIQCGAPPRIIFNPPSVNRMYEVEIGRRFSLSCSYDQNIHPAPRSFGVSRLNGNITMTSQFGNSHQVIAGNLGVITLMDADTYYCSGTYGNEQVFEESVNVAVRGLTGTADSVYLRMSFQTFERLRTNGLIFSSNEQLLNQLPVLAFGLIPERVPGVHNVDYCRIVNRREFDVQRRLVRAECKVTQYSNQGERKVASVFVVAEHVARLIPRSVAVFVDPVDISATGFCDAETISSESGTTFYWPETRGGVNATFTCPLNREIVVTRSCVIGGEWSQFDESACDGISGQLSNLIDLFSNLTTETYETAVSSLSSIIELSESNTNEQNSEVLNTVANYTAELATFVDDSSVIINNTVVQDMVEVVSSLLQWSPANIAITSSSSVLQSFEEVVSRYAQQLSLNQNQTISVSSLVIVAELRSTETFTNEGRTFTISGSMPSLDQTMPGQLSPQQDAAIRLPPSLFEELNSLPNVGVFFGRYETSTLFPVRRASNNGRQTQVGSQVLAATVGQNLRLQNLSEPVTVTLKLQSREGLFMASGSETCVSWDFNIQNWTTTGCNTSVGLGGIITCRCNHLTNFAVLVDMCSRQQDCQPATRDCEAEVIRSETGTTYEWFPTPEGGVAKFSCPLMDTVIISRRCGVGGVWEAFSEEACGVVNEQLNRLNNSFNNLTTETVEAAVASLAQAVEQTEGRQVEQNVAVLSTVADYLTDVATFVNNPNITINSTVVESVAQVVSSLLQWNPENIVVASSSRVVQSFETVVYLFAQQLGLNETQNITLNSLTIIAELRSRTSLIMAGRSFAIGNNEFIIDDEDQVMPGQLSSQQDAAISLPASLFQTIDDREDVGIFFALYNTSTLFPVNGGINRNARRRREVGSRVLAATVGPGLNFPNLEENVTIVLRLVTTEFTAPGSEVCVSWSFTLQDWTTEGCTINITQLEEGIVTCSCSHLTNFAVLVDACSRQENCQPLNPVVSDLLTYVSYIGISISIVSLIVTIVTLLIFKKLRQKDASKYHIQLSLAMLFMLIVSLALVALSVRNVTDPYGGCVMVSILVHYFTLVAVMWMGAEALLMFQKLVIIFTRVTTKFMVYVSIICWTLPILFVLIPLIVDLATGNSAADDIIVRRPNGTEDISFCFLSHPGAFWGAFLVPIFAVMLFNIVVFIWVIVILVRHTRGTAARKKEAVSNKTIIRLMISISGVMFLFGLTWLFAILTFSVTGLREAFQILFTVFNSFQGFFIFLFFCVFNKEAVESWKELVSCGKYKSKVLHPSQVKLSSTAVTKKAKQSKTGSTGLTLSSGGKYTSEASRSDYESATLMKGNVYEKAPFETKVDLGTNNSTIENPVVEDEGLTETAAEHTEATTVPVVIVEQTDSGSGELQNGGATSTGEKGKKKKKALSLKARIKRYSTKKISKHHVEEVEVDFDSDNSSQESGGEEDTTTQL